MRLIGGLAMLVAPDYIILRTVYTLQQSKSLLGLELSLSLVICAKEISSGGAERERESRRGGIVLNRILGRRQLLHSYQSASALRPTGFLSSAPVDWAELIMKMHF